MYRYTAEILIAIAAEKEASDVHLIACRQNAGLTARSAA